MRLKSKPQNSNKTLQIVKSLKQKIETKYRRATNVRGTSYIGI